MTAIFSIQDVSVHFGGLAALNRFSMDVEKGAMLLQIEDERREAEARQRRRDAAG